MLILILATLRQESRYQNIYGGCLNSPNLLVLPSMLTFQSVNSLSSNPTCDHAFIIKVYKNNPDKIYSCGSLNMRYHVIDHDHWRPWM